MSDFVPKEFQVTLSLGELETDEQRRVLDTVAQVRKCGLDSILSLPQIVVCGQQSSGKSSVLEAITEIPFPRKDNLCTRFATEIILRRGSTDSLSIKILPDRNRPPAEQATIAAFHESIQDFTGLPQVMDRAMQAMGIQSTETSDSVRAFARDILSIEIEGPNRPQLTLVDIPGLIEAETKGVTQADIDLVNEITDNYIEQPRTICLAVISATSDYGTQRILKKVRQVDPEGERTLGVITKPDRLPAGSGSERSFIELARNEDVFFKLGWHVLKNRTFEENDASFLERNASEVAYFQRSNFKELPGDSVGIDNLRTKLSALLFEHVKHELPKLRRDLEDALANSRRQLEKMGMRRSIPGECRNFLSQLSLDCYEICKAGTSGYYDGRFFEISKDEPFTSESPQAVRRIRALVQTMNHDFSEKLRTKGHKFAFPLCSENNSSPEAAQESSTSSGDEPIQMTRPEALAWVRRVLSRTRGREVGGTFNPLLIGELFWEQSSRWHEFAQTHVEKVFDACSAFVSTLLSAKCPKDIKNRLWESYVEQALNSRGEKAEEELHNLLSDLRDYPINYNHYYNDTINKLRGRRLESSLTKTLDAATPHTNLDEWESKQVPASIDVRRAVSSLLNQIDPSMENVSCEEALDCVFSLYKVFSKTFVANVTTQVIERHIMRGLERIFSPVAVNNMSDAQVESIASEGASIRRQRSFLEDRITRLVKGQNEFRLLVGGVA